MVVDTKLYDLLGVKPDCSEADLKRAFKKKAFELHPDRNSEPDATEKFQAVNEAYEILKDADKRAAYDRYGGEALKQGGMGTHGMNLFDMFFNSGMGMGRSEKRRPRTKDIQQTIECTLEELYNGKEVDIKVNRTVLCSACSGNGCAEGKKPKTCSDCGGQGKKVQVVKMGFMISQTLTTCPTCNGVGQIIPSGDKCKKCRGQKVAQEVKNVTVHVERGMEGKDRITFQGMSNENPDADTGDLYVIINEKPHPIFKRNHDDLLIKKKLSLSQALLGTKFSVKHLDGRILVMETQAQKVIVPNAVNVIEREGMPNRSNPFSRGKLFVLFEIDFPVMVSPELADALLHDFPATDETVGIANEDLYPVSMKDSALKDFENQKEAPRNNRQRDGVHDEEGYYQQQTCHPM